MGRPLGSKNKPKNKPKVELVKNKDNSFGIRINFEKKIENTPLTRDSHRGYINFGTRNDYPNSISNLYYTSPTLKACVDFSVNAILGDGVDYESMKIDGTQISPNYQQTWDDFIEAIALDYMLYGSYAFQIIKNNDNKTYSFYHQPICDVRCSDYDEDGVITSYWISKDWTATGKFAPIELPRFGFQDNDNIEKGKVYLFVYEKYSPDLMYYYQPQWIGALKAVQTEAELLTFDLKTTLNSFLAQGILTLPRVDSDDEKNVIIDNITAMFSGSDNANSLIIMFKNSDDEKPAEFTALSKNTNDVDLFANTNTRAQDRILSAFSIPSKQLIGITKDGAQLGGNSNELAVAFNLYNQLRGNKLRKNIVNTINKMLSLNGIDMNLILKPLTFDMNENKNEEKNNNDTVDTSDKEDIKEDNIEEKETTDENKTLKTV